MKNQVLAESTYNPSVGCGWNIGKVIDEGDTILFSKVGWRTNIVYRMPKEAALKAVELLKKEVYNVKFVHSYWQCIGGSFCKEEKDLLKKQQEYINNIWNNFQSFIYTTKRYNRKYFPELDELIRTAKSAIDF